MMDSKCSGDL